VVWRFIINRSMQIAVLLRKVAFSETTLESRRGWEFFRGGGIKRTCSQTRSYFNGWILPSTTAFQGSEMR
jgi:hypothetical protein